MAKVTLGQKREIEGGYHIYRQPSEAGDLITVRRKLAMPSDVEHNSSKPTQRHRQIFSRASKRWAAIPAPVRADLQHNYGYVPVQGHPAAVDYKVLKGRELFLSQEMHGLEYLNLHALLPWWLCIVTTDQVGRVIDIPLELRGKDGGYYTSYYRFYLAAGNTLFYPVPRGQQAYQLRYAETGWINQMAFYYSEDEIKKLRYQAVHPNITVAHAEYHNWETHPYQDNWKPRYPPLTTDLAQYEVHHIIGWPPVIYYPEAAISLIWRKVNQATHSLTIALLNVKHEMTIQLRRYEENLTMWTIEKDLFGTFRLNPRQQTCLFDAYSMVILTYE